MHLVHPYGYKWAKKYIWPKRFGVFTLIFLHLILTTPLDVFAHSTSPNYRIDYPTFNEGGSYKNSSGYRVFFDNTGEPIAGGSSNSNFSLGSGFINAVHSNPPILIQPIPNYIWAENTGRPNVLDLDDYFESDYDSPFTYTVSGNSDIIVVIDPESHLVSFSQAQAYYGTEKVVFTAADSEGNFTLSNSVTLQVEGVDNPPVLEFIEDITCNETELVTLTPRAADLDNDPITYSFTAPLDENGRWQTGYDSAGEYTVTVTATDSTGLFDAQEVHIFILNVNRPPEFLPAFFEQYSEIDVDEGGLVVIALQDKVSDADNDPLEFYFTSPLDETGRWLTDNSHAGTYTPTVTVSDGTDTVSQQISIIVRNVNRAPEVTLAPSSYTLNPGQVFDIIITASDPDGDTMTFILERDGTELTRGPIDAEYRFSGSISTIGDHEISVTVTDALELSTTERVGLEVVDPNLDRNSINPVMGDFNGDSLTDLGIHNNTSGLWEIALSEGGNFTYAADWLTGFGTSRDWFTLGGDFNGDGRSDIGIYNNTNGECRIAASTGSGFSLQGLWGTFSGESYKWQPTSGDFNADGRTDLAVYNKETGELKVALSTGTNFGSFGTWINSFAASSSASLLSGDFNADGLTDAVVFTKSAGEFRVAFSDGRKFNDCGLWISGFAADKSPIISDFNSDGFTDIGYFDKSGGTWYKAISTGTKFVNKGTWLSGFGSTNDDFGTSGDFNGDGLADAATFNANLAGIERWGRKLSEDKIPDLLIRVDNGMGGETGITYDYAAKFANQLLPFPVYAVRSITTKDTLPEGEPEESYTQTFTYEGGYYDAGEREFRGFRMARVTDSITGNYTETYFHQGKESEDGALKGRVEKMLAYDSDSRLISEVINTWEVAQEGNPPDTISFPKLTMVETTVYEETDTSLTTRSQFVYDNLGNIIDQFNEGDINLDEDDRSTHTEYTRAYGEGFNRPHLITLKDNEENIVSKQTLEYYPEDGNLARENAWLFAPPLTKDTEYGLITTQYFYDSFGNLELIIDARGQSTSTDYESTYYTFPRKVTNALGHQAGYVYDARFGVVKDATDANNNTTTTIYDALGRITQTKNSHGLIVTSYNYPDSNTVVSEQLGLKPNKGGMV